MRIIKSQPNEFLVVGRKGRVENRGASASALLWPGSTYVRVPSTKQEACFEMTQESRDGIPLRFKGIVVYRVIDPVAAAGAFDFTRGDGIDQPKPLIAHIALGELRAVAATLTMRECIEGRKTTLSGAVAAALDQATPGWGLSLDVVQVAQVFIVDPDVRRKLEAELRNELDARSELSRIRSEEAVRAARAAALLREEQEKAALEQKRLEAAAPVRTLALTQQREECALELEVHRARHAARVLEVESELLLDRARQDLRREILPLEQIPAIAQALSGLLRGAQLSIYGGDSNPLAVVAPIVDLLAARLGTVRAKPSE